MSCDRILLISMRVITINRVFVSEYHVSAKKQQRMKRGGGGGPGRHRALAEQLCDQHHMNYNSAVVHRADQHEQKRILATNGTINSERMPKTAWEADNLLASG